MEKAGIWLTVLIIALVLVGGFFVFNLGNNENPQQTTTSSVDTSQNSQADSGNTVSEQTSQETPQEATQNPVKEFDIVAKQWEFVPGTITVNQGDTVILNIESIDVDHGFALPTFGVSESLSPGNKVKVQFVADQKGTFSFFCNVFCGSGHSGMRGTLVVQ